MAVSLHHYSTPMTTYSDPKIPTPPPLYTPQMAKKDPKWTQNGPKSPFYAYPTPRGLSCPPLILGVLTCTTYLGGVYLSMSSQIDYFSLKHCRMEKEFDFFEPPRVYTP